MAAIYMSNPEGKGGMVPVLPPQSRELEGESLKLTFARDGTAWRAFVSDADGQFGSGATGATPAEAVQKVFEFLQRVPQHSPWRVPS